MHSSGLKVVIVGGGIGGLTAALALRDAGFEFELFERAPEIRPIGAGISLWPNGARIMHHFGVGPDLEPLSPEMRWLRYRSPDGQLLRDIPLDRMVELSRQRPLPLARTDLQRVLFDHVGPEHVRLERDCVDVRQDADSATAIFADGSEASGDLVVGADGINSVVRAHLLGRPDPPEYAGNVNWNGLIDDPDDELDSADGMTIAVGDSRRVGLMPVNDKQVYFFFDAPVPVDPVEPDGWRAELASLYAGWGPPARTLIERFDPARMVRQPIFEVAHLDRFVRGRVLLLGDAAHGTTPTIGQGASQAMEDSVVLTRCLVEAERGIDDALERYQDLRRDRVHEVAVVSRNRTDLMMGKDPEVTQRWYDELRGDPADDDGDVVDPMTRIAASGPL
ncbi:MAG: FAD-dependent urate hydroxylase [Thermoleophilaceae bacterium]|nr:FAD-dependent urate hydroxylase [Thermoleophilaceae bacterium]